MPTKTVDDTRSSLLQVLLDKVETEPYPSATMLDFIESLLKPNEVPDYVDQLVERVRADTYPSIDMLRRILKFV
ncbi:hypothetical protein [Arthrobacter pigmenti]